MIWIIPILGFLVFLLLDARMRIKNLEVDIEVERAFRRLQNDKIDVLIDAEEWVNRHK